MTLIAPPATNKDFGPREHPEPGMHMARIFRIVDFGTQEKKDPLGAITLKRQLRIDWELPLDLLTQGDLAGKPFCVGETFTFSVHEKSSLRKKVLNQLVPGINNENANQFDFSTLLGKECLINIIRDKTATGKEFDKISAVTPLMKGQSIPKDAPANPHTIYGIGDANVDALPNWQREVILKSKEMANGGKPYAGTLGPQGSVSGASDDIPF
jgi:hypothetical protein